MKKSIRAGGIVVNSEKKIALANEHLWGFPRGGVEAEESLESAARREVLEEVGLSDIELVKSLGKYERYPEGITKDTPGAFPMEVNMFLFKTDYTGKLIPQSENVKEAGWFTFEQAVERLSNIEDKNFLLSVKDLIL